MNRTDTLELALSFERALSKKKKPSRKPLVSALEKSLAREYQATGRVNPQDVVIDEDQLFAELFA